MQELTQEQIKLFKPSITDLEIEYVNDAIRHGWGNRCYEYIKRLEKTFAEYVGTKYALATASGTGAIHLSMMALGIKSDDEVIVPEITWVASASPALYLGAKPIFVDISKDNWCLDPAKIEAAITPKTKAIVVVHIYGNAAEMDEIMRIAEKYNLMVLEDAAQALGSTYKGQKCGSIGHAGTFSFHGTKTMTTGEGGILVTNDLEIYEEAVRLNDQGRDPKVRRTYWMENYGYKYKMSNLQAALGCAQIERVEELVEKKRQIFQWYREYLADVPDIQLNHEQDYVRNSYWMSTMVVGESYDFDRDHFTQSMKEKGVDVRPYFYPLSSLPFLDEKSENEVAYALYSRGVNLPSHHDLEEHHIKKVCDEIHTYLMK